MISRSVGSGIGPGNRGAVALGRFHDLFGRLIDERVIVGLQSDSDSLFCCHYLLLPP